MEVYDVALNIYTKKDLIPQDMLFINANDPFFNCNTQLADDGLTATILRELDYAVRNSPYTFIGREPELGALNKEHLSTGTKTLLNILSHPNICFNVVECSPNALDFLVKFTEGNIYWKHPIHVYGDDGACDIILDGAHYSDFYDMQDAVMGNDI